MRLIDRAQYDELKDKYLDQKEYIRTLEFRCLQLMNKNGRLEDELAKFSKNWVDSLCHKCRELVGGLLRVHRQEKE